MREGPGGAPLRQWPEHSHWLPTIVYGVLSRWRPGALQSAACGGCLPAPTASIEIICEEAVDKTQKGLGAGIVVTPWLS